MSRRHYHGWIALRQSSARFLSVRTMNPKANDVRVDEPRANGYLYGMPKI